jgi:hypothetical protein
MKTVNCVKHTWWGAELVILLRLYEAFIRSRVEYEAFLFHTFKKKQVQKLENLGLTITQAASRRLPTAAVRVRVQVRACGICGGQSDTGAGFLLVLRFPLPFHSSHIIWGW